MIALVDCNNFFASCERLFRPDLQDKPVLVLSNNDGCVVARSQEVRELGVPMGVPYFQIKDIVKQHDIQCFSSNFPLYSNISQRILGVLQQYAPQIEVYSIDEAFMDLSQLPQQNMNTWGNSLHEGIQKDIGMPVSVGIAPTKTLAKLASGYAKNHKKTCVLSPEADDTAYQAVLSATQVEDVWGVGRKVAPRLRQAGVRTALQLSQTPEAWLHQQLGISGVRMKAELKGRQMYAFEEERALQKTIMASRSFGHTIKNYHELETAVSSFVSQMAFRLRKFEQCAASCGLYVRYKTPNHETKSQSSYVRLSVATNDTAELISATMQLLQKMYDPEVGYLKAGVFANHLSSANICQVDLFDVLSPAQRKRRGALMGAIDAINNRYGEQTIHIGTIDQKATRWHAKKKRMSPAYTTSWSELPLVYARK
jgi:DNA polymerase V